MLVEGKTALSKLDDAIRKFQAREDRRVDLKALREGIDLLKYELFYLESISRNRLPRSSDPVKRDRS